jgi:hypothetical protein
MDSYLISYFVGNPLLYYPPAVVVEEVKLRNKSSIDFIDRVRSLIALRVSLSCNAVHASSI